jgi:hypothetical protein
MLKIHQRLGLITLAPLVATFITSANAGGKHTSTADRTTHLVLGSVSGDLYFMTATPSAHPESPERKLADRSVCIKPWPGFTVRG